MVVGLAGVLAVLRAQPAAAATLTAMAGTLSECTSGCATGASTDVIEVSQARPIKLAIDYVTMGSNTTIQVERSIDEGATWSLVAGTAGSAVAAYEIDAPIGRYRINRTTCGASCAWKVVYRRTGPFGYGD
jgi:hypothetical protein